MRILLGALVLLLSVAACSRTAPLARPACSADAKLGTICGFENPEDVAHIPSLDWLLVSNLRREGKGGFLSALPVGSTQPFQVWPPTVEKKKGTEGFARSGALGEPGCGTLDADRFAPHGLYVDSRDPVAPVVYVVNHGGRESIEIFTLGRRGNDNLLFWSGCIELPPGASGNDVAVAADGEVIVSNYMPTYRKGWNFLKSTVGLSTGDILLWNRKERWRHLPNTSASAPNGVEIDADDTWIFYSETGRGKLVRIARDGGEKTEIDVPGRPDNLNWNGPGSLLLATHTDGLAFLRCLREEPCRSPWSVVAVDPRSLSVSLVVEHDGDAVGAVAAGLAVKGHVVLSAVFGDRIGWLRP